MNYIYPISRKTRRRTYLTMFERQSELKCNNDMRTFDTCIHREVQTSVFEITNIKNIFEHMGDSWKALLEMSPTMSFMISIKIKRTYLNVNVWYLYIAIPNSVQMNWTHQGKSASSCR